MSRELVFFVRAESSSSPAELWSRLAAGDTSGWPVLRDCRQLVVGAPILFDIAHPGGTAIRSSGRVVAIVEGERIDVAQETPWSGRIRLELAPLPTGTRITVKVELSDECVPWFSGEPTSSAHRVPGSARGPKIGLLAPLSGTTGVLGRSIANAATMAVEDLNASGAFGRRAAQLVIGDDHTDPAFARHAFAQLTAVEGCDVVVACVSSASMQAIRPAAMARGTLVLFAAMSERSKRTSTYFQLGESPLDQLAASVPLLMRSANARNWFILGSDYVWPRSVGMVANEVIERNAGRIAGEHYLPLGSSRFDEVIEAIAQSGADLILSSLVGLDAVMFERAFYESGLRERFQTLATNFDDSVLDHLGRDAANGIWSTQDYFMPTLADEMDAIATRYRARFGELAPRLSSMAKSVHDTINLYAQALHVAKSADPLRVSEVLRSGRIGGSRLLRRERGEVITTQIAEVSAGAFRHIVQG
jgi:urea transport system substrate-binding protein